METQGATETTDYQGVCLEPIGRRMNKVYIKGFVPCVSSLIALHPLSTP